MSRNQSRKKAQGRRGVQGGSLGVDSDRVHLLAQQHGLEESTTKAYLSQVERARKWIAKAAQETEKLAELKPLDSTGPGDFTELFASAFGDIPNKYSPHAVALYLTHLHFDQGLGQSTVEQAHAALKNMWNSV
jgi:hypothetical protein